MATPRGELVLRQRDDVLEVISNGVFLMDTRDGRSERLLVRAALDRLPDVATCRVLIGGLGVGFSLLEALTDDRVTRVTVAEVEPALVEWHRAGGPLAAISHGAIDDPRVVIEVADFWDVLGTPVEYDAVCLDTDNGPDWQVTPDNARLWAETGLTRLTSRLRAGGVISVWAAAPAPSYLALMQRFLQDVVVHEMQVARGDPDVVMVGTSRR